MWANVDAPSYDAFAHPLDFWVNDVGMVFFFALAATEVFEATLPGEDLSRLPGVRSRPSQPPLVGMAAPARSLRVTRTLRTLVEVGIRESATE